MPRVALVTGGTRGIGAAICKALKSAGYTVAANYAGNDEAAQSFKAETGINVYKWDVSSFDACAAGVKQVEAELGPVDVLVNNAGITGPLRDVHDYEGGDMAAVLLTNVAGYVRVIHAFLPLLERSPDPRIVNVSSGLGSFGLAHDESRSESRAPSPLYAAAKSAINMLTVRYAQLLPGIRINSADPGMTATDLSGGRGHSVEDGTDAIIAFALGGPDSPTGAFRDRTGDLPW